MQPSVSPRHPRIHSSVGRGAAKNELRKSRAGLEAIKNSAPKADSTCMASVQMSDSKQKPCGLGRRPTDSARNSIAFAGGFTAIELIGVLAVLAMLAAAVVPNVIRKIDRATLERERADFGVMANGLVQSIKREKQVPASNTVAVAAAIAKYCDIASIQITNTPRRLSRLILVDPAANINGSGLGSGYVQGSSGSSTRPLNTRGMIVSTI